MLVSFVIPCYNSEKTIEKVVKEIVDTIKVRPEYKYEIILCNDGSRDNTYNVLSKLAREQKQIKVINFSKNFGQHAALMAAYKVVQGNVVIGLDDDGEHSPRDMFKLIDKLQEGYDYVCAKHSQKKHSRIQNIGSQVNNMMANILIGKPKEVKFSSYYAMRKFVVKEIIKYENPYPYIGGLLLRVTRNIGDVEIEHRQRLAGQSGYSFKKMLSLWINGFTAFSVKPLRIATLLGGGIAIVGFLYAVYIIIHRLLGTQVMSGWSSMMSTLLILGGLIMVMLGLIGEYIGRIYISINKSPQYVVKELINVMESEKTYEE